MIVKKAPSLVLTGSNGYLGKQVLAALKATNVKIESISFSKFLRGAAEPTALRMLQQADVVCHLAGVHPHQTITQSDNLYWEANVVGTKKLLAAAQNASRIVFASSAMASEEKILPMANQGLLAYASSKRAAEALVADYAGYKASSLSLRFQALAGAHREPCFGLIGNALRAAREGTPLKIFRQAPPREYLHVADAASAIVAACLAPIEGHSVIDIGTGLPQHVSTVVETVERITGVEIKKRSVSCRIEPAPRTSDLLAARKLLNWGASRSSLPQIIIDQLEGQHHRATMCIPTVTGNNFF
ncbi:NAD-dependent epimerase/dehydratase family protein [Rheinheimera sp. NSM]|uniref:NAD-dependent epimerase/dehydratase family protein n=1 Tax=Rheinheimera sp. NSM TaxID=3457884 RepID=UPI0040366779